MANAVTPTFDYTYPGQISREIFYKPSILTPDITQIFTVQDMIKSKRQLTLANVLSKIVKAYSGCSITPSGAVDLTNRTLEVCEVEFRLEQCKDAFEDTWMEDLTPFGMQEFELGTEVRNIITTLITDALRRDNFRIFSFGDSADGNADYNQCDGLWTRLIAGEASYEVTKIDDITTLNQTSGTRALDYLRNQFEGADNILKQLPNASKKFFVTGNMYENLLQTYQDSSLDNGGLTQWTEDGATTLRFNGIDVVPIYAWDEYLADADNPYNGVFNTASIYTTPQNHVVGLGTRDIQGVQQWYERKDRLYYFEGHYRIGYNYVHSDLQAISYGQVT